MNRSSAESRHKILGPHNPEAGARSQTRSLRTGAQQSPDTGARGLDCKLLGQYNLTQGCAAP
jgi:hypothetical protein